MSRASVHPLPDVSDHTLLVVGTGPLQEPLLAALARRGMDVECADPKEALEMSRAAVPDLVLLVGRAAMGGGQALIRAFRSTPELAHTRLLVVARSASPDESTVAQLAPSLGAEGLADAVLRVMHGLPESSEDRVALQELVETATGAVVRQKPSRRPASSIRPAVKRARPAAPPVPAAPPTAAAPAASKRKRGQGTAVFVAPPAAAAPPPAATVQDGDSAEAVFGPPALDLPTPAAPASKSEPVAAALAPPPPAAAPPVPASPATPAPPPLPSTTLSTPTPAPPSLPSRRAEPSAPSEPAQAHASVAPQRPSQRAPKATLVGMPVHEVLQQAQMRASVDQPAPPAANDHPDVDDEEPTTVAVARHLKAPESEEPTVVAAAQPPPRPAEEPAAPAAKPPAPRVFGADPHRPGLTSLSAMLVASGRPTQGARLELSQRTALPVVDPRSERPADGDEQTANLRRVRKARKRLRQDSGPIDGKTSSDPSSLFDLPMMDNSETGLPIQSELPATAQAGEVEPSARALFASAFHQLSAALRMTVRQGLRGVQHGLSPLMGRLWSSPAENATAPEPAVLHALGKLSGPTAAALGAVVALAAVGLVVLAWPASGPTEVPALTVTAKPSPTLPTASAREAQQARPAETEKPAAPAPSAAAEAEATDDEVDALDDDIDEDATDEEDDDPGQSRDARAKRRVAQANAAVLQGHRFRRQGAPNKAAAAYQRALKALPNYPRALMGLVQVSLARKQGKKALLYARKLVRRKGRDAQAQRLLGDAYRLSGNQRAAKVAYRKAARLGSRLARKRLSE